MLRGTERTRKEGVGFFLQKNTKQHVVHSRQKNTRQEVVVSPTERKEGRRRKHRKQSKQVHIGNVGDEKEKIKELDQYHIPRVEIVFARRVDANFDDMEHDVGNVEWERGRK